MEASPLPSAECVAKELVQFDLARVEDDERAGFSLSCPMEGMPTVAPSGWGFMVELLVGV